VGLWDRGLVYSYHLCGRFYQKADSNSSRKLFRYTLIHLPLLMTLMCLGKKSQQDKDKELQEQLLVKAQ